MISKIMFKRNDKRRLYWLIDQYLSEQINGWTFCNEYYYSYSLEIESDNLTDIEQSAFSELDKISSRYTDIKEDLIKYPDTYYNEEQLKKIIIETKKKLQDKISKIE